jgi:toxin ParE1/3/4
MRLRYTTEALDHLKAIRDFLSARNPAAARRLLADINAAALMLCEYPNIGRNGEEPGTHEWVVRRSPYLIIYKIDEAFSEIIVLGIFHAAQDWRHRFG